MDEARRVDHKRQQERAAIQREALQRAETRRQQDASAAAERERRVAESVHERWAEQRRAALKASVAARRAEWALFDSAASTHVSSPRRCRAPAGVRNGRSRRTSISAAENGRRRRVTDDMGSLDA